MGQKMGLGNLKNLSKEEISKLSIEDIKDLSKEELVELYVAAKESIEQARDRNQDPNDLNVDLSGPNIIFSFIEERVKEEAQKEPNKTTGKPGITKEEFINKYGSKKKGLYGESIINKILKTVKNSNILKEWAKITKSL